MIDFFDHLYSIPRHNPVFKRIRLYSIFNGFLRLVINLIAPIYFRITEDNSKYALKAHLKNNGRIIISLTTFPARIDRIWLVIETLLRQTIKPDKIILWLSQEQFPSIDVLPKRLLKQKDRGLEIRLKNGDISSHKKYYYTLQEFPKDYLLTVDDDILYRSTMVADIIKYSQLYPGSIVAQYCRRILWLGNKPESFTLWPILEEETEPNVFSFFGSGGGTFFPPLTMDPDMLNLDLIMMLTPTADDIWLNAMCRLKGTLIVKTKYYSNRLPVFNWKNVTLHSVNNGLNRNDMQLKAVRDYYIKTRGVDPFKVQT